MVILSTLPLTQQKHAFSKKKPGRIRPYHALLRDKLVVVVGSLL